MTGSAWIVQHKIAISLADKMNMPRSFAMSVRGPDWVAILGVDHEVGVTLDDGKELSVLTGKSLVDVQNFSSMKLVASSRMIYSYLSGFFHHFV
jgi:hypothetical protein